ncbi:MAG: carbohydrate ABC transporter permease [Roseburia hominis]
MFPILWVFLASFKDIREFTRNVTIFPDSFDFSKIKATWDALKFQKYYLNSFISVAGSVVCAVIFNGLLAYGFAVLKPKGHKIAFGLVMWSLLIPATTSIVAVFRNINMVGLYRSFVPLWLAFGANAFYVVLFKEFFEEIPTELLEAAKLDGAGVLTVFTKIMLPLSKPIIMVVIIFSLTAAWSDFLLPYLVLNGSGKETVMVKLFAFKDTPTDAVSVLRATLFAIIPPTILFAIFQKQITDGATAGAVKG